MPASDKIKIFIVDDDAIYMRLLQMEFETPDQFEIRTFPTGEMCLAAINEGPAIVVLDYHLDGIDERAMNGLDTLDGIISHNENIAVVMLSSQDKIDVAVTCMHHGAFDYVVKSETAFIRLRKIIDTVLEKKRMQHKLSWYMSRM
jgi:two-component system, OmpR family, response regulator